jgi:hypothetical protein
MKACSTAANFVGFALFGCGVEQTWEIGQRHAKFSPIGKLDSQGVGIKRDLSRKRFILEKTHSISSQLVLYFHSPICILH